MDHEFQTHRVKAALFDLRQDIIAEIPREVIEQWVSGSQSEQDAQRILEASKVSGFVVSSDTSGLSKMSKDKELIEVLALVNRPKELVYSYGTALGGRGIGVWAADNTQMFYPEDTDAATLVAMLMKIQEVLASGDIHIGFAVHKGEFYELGGGLYGHHAELVENFAEEQVAGGEVCVSTEVHDLLEEDPEVMCTIRDDIKVGEHVFYRVHDAAECELVPVRDTVYPIPYSHEFYRDLKTVLSASNRAEKIAELSEKYILSRTVVLVERERVKEGSGMASLLNDLSLCAVVERHGASLVAMHAGEEVKTVGSLSLYTFESSEQAFSFASGIRKELEQEGIRTKIGIDCGDILLFTLPNGTKDIAGGPVNIASKIAQDKGEFGGLYMTDAVYRAVGTIPLAQEQHLEASGVPLHVWRV